MATLRYDADGNLVSGPGVTYEYDAEDRLIAWTSSGGRTRFTVNLYSGLDQARRARPGDAPLATQAPCPLRRDQLRRHPRFPLRPARSSIAFSGTNGCRRHGRIRAVRGHRPKRFLT
ncbi:MAG: RHS repeat domain-containing protein [Bryobacterales bacterium]